MSAPPQPLRIGVMLDTVQLSDITCIDIFNNISTAWLSALDSFGLDLSRLAPHAVPVTFFFLASSLEPATVTPGLRYLPTHTYDSCPRDLDLVVTGGPALAHRPPDAARFVREAWLTTRVWMATCTGSLWLAAAGVLGGQKATTNRCVLAYAQKMHGATDWLNQRWVVDEKPYEGPGGGRAKGELWTAGGAGAGIDMVAQYCLQNYHKDLVHTLALESLEFAPDGAKGQFYKPGSESSWAALVRACE